MSLLNTVAKGRAEGNQETNCGRQEIFLPNEQLAGGDFVTFSNASD